MKIRLIQQSWKKTVAFVMSVAMTATCIGTLTVPKEVKASEYVFEDDFEGNCDRWLFTNTGIGEFVQSPDDSENRVLKLSSKYQYWGMAKKEIGLKPNTAYVMEVKVKGENISVSDEVYSDGVYINVDGESAYPMDYVNTFRQDSFGWTTMEVYFYTNSRGNTTLICGVGDMSGTAYFDEVRIREYTYTEADEDKRIIDELENIRVSLTPETIENSGISEEKYQQFLNDLQSTYKAYYDLTGSAPFYGDKINLLETFQPAYKRYGAIAGNSVLLCGSQVNALKDYMENDTINFGWLHELGHDFDISSDIQIGTHSKFGWDFHDEFWANTKMLYVLDNTDVSTSIDGLKAGSLDEILLHYEKNYDKWKNEANGVFSDSYHDALTYIFGTIIQDIGWEPFVETFHEYTAGEIPEPATRLAKLERFLYAMQQNYNPGGNEVKSHFKDGEYEAVYNYYWNLENSENSDLDGKKYIAGEAIMNLVGDEEYPEVIQTVIDSEKEHAVYAGSQEELDEIVENIEAIISPITVCYKDSDEGVIATREVKPGDEIPADVVPDKKEYDSFKGWFMDESCTIPVEKGSTNTLEKEITVYSKWEPDNYTITYELNGGTNSELNPAAFSTDDSIIVFEDPEREGYIFAGWYRNPDFTKRIYDFEPKDFSGAILKNFTVYAKWEEKPATVTPEPTITVTPEPTMTVTPEPTMTVTPEPTITATPEPTMTVTPEPTATATPEPTMTVTPEPTITATPEPTMTVTPKSTATATPEPTATATPEPIATATPEPIATATPEPTATVTPEPTMTVTPEPTATVTPTKAATPTAAPEKVSIKKVTVAKIPAQYYYGKAVKPDLKITYQGKTLKKGTDYKLSYKNNKKAGTGKVTITGKGNYTGTKTITFKIVNGYVKYKVSSETILYKFPSDTSKKITTLSKGKIVKVYADSEVKDAKKKKWVKVKAGSKNGYVQLKKLKKVK